jgi:hypothetical protein
MFTNKNSIYNSMYHSKKSTQNLLQTRKAEVNLVDLCPQYIKEVPNIIYIEKDQEVPSVGNNMDFEHHV